VEAWQAHEVAIVLVRFADARPRRDSILWLPSFGATGRQLPPAGSSCRRLLFSTPPSPRFFLFPTSPAPVTAPREPQKKEDWHATFGYQESNLSWPRSVWLLTPVLQETGDAPVSLHVLLRRWPGGGPFPAGADVWPGGHTDRQEVRAAAW